MRATELRRVTLPSALTLEVAERGRGAGVLFLHGYTDSWRSFESILPLLPDGLRALVPSQRGHGESDRPMDGYGIDQLASDAAALLTTAGVERATVVGHSMGSLVAQMLAATHPGRVERLVLVGSATCFDTAELRGMAETLRELRDPVPQDFARDFQVSTLHRPIPEERLASFVAESQKVPVLVWRQALAGLLEFRSDALPPLGVPTLLIWGERDRIAPRSEQERLQRRIRGSSLRVVEDTGHAPHWERPQRFVDELMAFLSPERRAVPGGTPAPR